MSYEVTMPVLKDIAPSLESLFMTHYAEMRTRLEGLGITVSDYAPRRDQYLKAAEEGWLLTFVLTWEGEPVGYCQVYVTNDMHNGDKIAQEDTIYVLPNHRNGAGRLLADRVHEELKGRGCKRLNVTTATDLRVTKWLERQGYKHTANTMTLTF